MKSPITYVDARHTCPPFPIPPQTDLRGNTVVSEDGDPERWAKAEPRSLSGVTAICFHIFGAMVGASSAAIKRCGSVSDARLWRFAAQRHPRTYHWLVDHQERRIIRKLPAAVWSYHGNGANRFSVGHCYEAADGNGPFDWDLAIEGIVRCVEAERRDGAPIRFGYAHSQFSAMRAGDPGEEYWRRAVMPAAKDVGLVLDVESFAGTGSPIRKSWRVPFEVQS